MYDVFERLLSEKNLTPYQVSKATGVSQATLSAWKKRGGNISYTHGIKIADYLGVSYDYLIGAEEQPRKKLYATDLFAGIGSNPTLMEIPGSVRKCLRDETLSSELEEYAKYLLHRRDLE